MELAERTDKTLRYQKELEREIEALKGKWQPALSDF